MTVVNPTALIRAHNEGDFGKKLPDKAQTPPRTLPRPPSGQQTPAAAALHPQQ